MPLLRLILTTSVLLGPVFCESEANSREFIRVCYFDRESHTRQGMAKYSVSDIDPTLCTHLIYRSAKLDITGLTLRTYPLYDEGHEKYQYREFTNLKQSNPRLKTLISIGFDNYTSKHFVQVSEPPSAFKVFIRNAIQFIRSRNFDGLDVQWWYPKLFRDEFTNFLKGFREAFDAEESDPNKRLLLTTGVARDYSTIVDSYDIPEMSKYPDYIFLLTYDYYTYPEFVNITAHNGPLSWDWSVSSFQSNYTINWTVTYYLDHGMPPSKMVVGVNGLGRAVTLLDVKQNLPGSPAVARQERNPYFNLPSYYMTYPEVCKLMDRKPMPRRFYDFDASGVYMANGTDWVAYINPYMMSEKVKWVMSMDLGGMMFTSLDYDDFNGSFCVKGRYPLIQEIKRNSVDRQDASISSESRRAHFRTEASNTDLSYKETVFSISVIIGAVLLVLGIVVFLYNQLSQRNEPDPEPPQTRHAVPPREKLRPIIKTPEADPVLRSTQIAVKKDLSGDHQP